MPTLAVHPTPETLTSHGRLAACVGAVALISMLAFEALAVAAAMPAIADALDGLPLYALVFGGPLATSMLGMVLAGRSCDRHGAWRSTAGGLVLFAAGLLVAGTAGSMGWMVAGRVLQGLGGGMLGVALYVGMGQLMPPALHPRMFGLFASAWVLPGLLGPSLAAWLVTHLGWRAVFLVVAAAVPVTALLLLPSLSRTPAPAAAAAPRASARSLVAWAALGGAGALLLHGAGSAGHAGLGLLMLALGATAAITSAWRLLPTGTLQAAPGLPAVVALRGLLAAAFATAEVFLPLLLTREQGWTLVEAGLALSTGALLWSAGSSVQSRLKAPADRRRGLQAGLTLLTLGIALVALQAVLRAAGAWVVVAWVITGFGIGLSFPMLSVLTLSLAPPDQQGQAASALQLSDALGTSAALALAGVLFNTAGGLAGCLAVLGVAGALALTAALLGHRAFAAARGSMTAS